ncbi:MAG: hypothetical protein JSW68_04440 [Burkholderiales bacterium]|nr:MAG: hypothetical protein JSW68_04440 [Burkholderiales bacterium]
MTISDSSISDSGRRRRPASGRGAAGKRTRASAAGGQGAAGMHVVKWGRRTSGNLLAEYDADRFPSIARVCAHLGLRPIEVRGDGEPSQVALGIRDDAGDPEAAEQRSTPFFSTLEALDFFCQRNLQSYLAIDRSATLPRRWFWQQAGSRSQPSGFGASLGSGASLQVSSRR